MFFPLRGYLAQVGPIYLIVLGIVPVAVMLKMADGIWGTLSKRFNVEFFGLTRRAPDRTVK